MTQLLRVMMNLINNFLDNNILFEIQKIITDKKFSWFLNEDEDCFVFEHSLNNDIFNPTILNDFKKKLRVQEFLDCKLLLITQTNKKQNCNNKITYDPHNNKKIAVFYLNTNDGDTIITNKAKFESIENSLLLIDPNTAFFHTTCTNRRYRLILQISYK
jgi:hypothetical protein